MSYCLYGGNFPHGPLARYFKLRVAHAPGMPGTFSPPPKIRDPDMHHGTCVTHVPWCMPGSLTCVFFWSWWRGKRSRHSRRMRNPQFYLSGKRPMAGPKEKFKSINRRTIALHSWACCLWDCIIFSRIPQTFRSVSVSVSGNQMAFGFVLLCVLHLTIMTSPTCALNQVFVPNNHWQRCQWRHLKSNTYVRRYLK